MNLTITDGTFTAGSNVFYSKNDNHSNQTTNNSIAVSGGSFTGTIAAFHENNTFSAFITGGTFRTDPSAYLAAGYKATENDGSWTVEEMAWDDYPADGTVMPSPSTSGLKPATIIAVFEVLFAPTANVMFSKVVGPAR